MPKLPTGPGAMPLRMQFLAACGFLLGGTALYWALCVGWQGLLLCVIYVQGYSEEEMVRAPGLAVAPTDILDGPTELQSVLSPPLRRIPPILHRTWKTANLSTMPPQWMVGYESCQQLHPNWTIFLWTDALARALIAENYAWFLPTYDGYQYTIQRVDALRYFVLYHYGGVYMDMDIGCTRPLDALITALPPGIALFPETEPLGVSNDVLLAPQRHPFFLHLLQSLPAADRWYGSPYPTVFFSTGPAFVSINIHRAAPWHRSGLRVLEHALYGARPTSFFFHVEGSSWHRTDANLIKWLAAHGGAVAGALPRSGPALLALAAPALVLLWGLRRRPPLFSEPDPDDGPTPGLVTV